MIMACLNVRDREATDVAKEFATSLAPKILCQEQPNGIKYWEKM